MMAFIGFAVVLLLGLALAAAGLWGALMTRAFGGKAEPALALLFAAGCGLMYYACTHAPFTLAVVAN